MSEFNRLLDVVESGQSLSRADMRRAMDDLLQGEVGDEAIEKFLLGLKARGETVDEIVAAAEAMRAKAIRVNAPSNAIDTCGTGGDGAGTYNISTAAALIVAGCGVPVAKHGNRAASSKSGSSDVLELLGVKLDAPPPVIERCIQEANIGFMFAAYHHRTVAHVAAVRRKIGVRTIFNILGPLANPASAQRQLMGVYDKALIGPLANALGALGAKRAWVVCGSDGLDELTTTGDSFVAEFKQGSVRRFTVSPSDASLPHAAPEDIQGGDVADNAAALRRLLSGEQGPYRDIALLNAAAALVIVDRATDLRDGAKMAARSIDDGRAQRALDLLVAISNERQQ